MAKNPMKQTTTYMFKYGGQSDSMDLNTLLLSQMHFSSILGEIKNEISKDSNLSIRIKPLQKGSIPLNLVSIGFNYDTKIIIKPTLTHI